MTTYGVKALRQIQMSRETALGTPSTDYTVWRGTGTLSDQRVVNQPEEDVGILPGTDRQYVPQKMGELSAEGEATFEQIGHAFDAGFYEATPTTDTGTGTGIIRTYTLPIASSDVKSSSDLQTYAFKGGDNAAVEYMKGSFVRNLSLSGAIGAALMNTITWQGREVASDTDGFAVATLPTVEEILHSKAKMWIDDSTATVGTTQITGIVGDVSIDITTGWQALFTADGTLEHSDLKQVKPEITMQVTFEHAGAAITEKANWRAGTARQIRIEWLGSALTTAGAHTYKTLRFDMLGKWENFDALGDRDGDDIVTGTFRAGYNSAAAKYFSAVLVNEVAAL